MKILVTGGTGYKGSVLIPKLLAAGHSVVSFDTEWFGNNLGEHDHLTCIRGDVRDADSIPLDGIECVIHLSSIANDPCGDLNPKLTWEVSALATMQLVDRCHRQNIGRFIYASSGSVYGLKEEEHVVEDLPAEPLSEYNKTKMVAERVVLSYAGDMVTQIVRPATVCGVSPRMRLDVAVNLLTMQALTNNEMTVLGGAQVRPNIHIDDITDVYLHFLDNPQFTGIYNAGFENISILAIAELISEKTGASISIKPSNDPRSYRVNSDKLLATGFVPSKSVSVAIDEIVAAYVSGELKDETRHYNLKWMESNSFATNVL